MHIWVKRKSENSRALRSTLEWCWSNVMRAHDVCLSVCVCLCVWSSRQSFVCGGDKYKVARGQISRARATFRRGKLRVRFSASQRPRAQFELDFHGSRSVGASSSAVKLVRGFRLSNIYEYIYIVCRRVRGAFESQNGAIILYIYKVGVRSA